MPCAVISYDKDLPEVPGRLSRLKPDAHLIKDGKVESGWRDSRLLLVPKIRSTVDEWRAKNYSGASEVTQRLFEYWFEETPKPNGRRGICRMKVCAEP